MIKETGNHIEIIKCPNCKSKQKAKVIHTNFFNIYNHFCNRCEYIITESDWNCIEKQ